MSKPGTLVWALAALGIATLDARPLVAQQSEAEDVRRIQALEALVQQAERDVADAQAALVLNARARQRGATETLQVGPIRIFALTEQAGLAADLFEQVWREDFGAMTGSPSLERSLFAFEWWTTQPSELYLAAETPGDDRLAVHRVEVARIWSPTRESLRADIRHAVWLALREDFPPESRMGQWLDDTSYDTAADTYRQLARRVTGPARACLANDVTGCAVGLGLAPPSSEVLAAYFTLNELQLTVNAASRPWATVPLERDAPDVRACLDEEQRSACVRALDGLVDAPVPESPGSHVLLLWHAVEIGGEGAWDRAIADVDASPPQALANASRRDIEGLVSSWIADLAEKRPAAYAGLGRSGWISLLWLLVLTAFAMRSTRWRLG